MVCIYVKTFLQYGIVQQYEIPEEPMMVAECTEGYYINLKKLDNIISHYVKKQ